ncbi:MAG: hypothetical protein H8E15_07200 [Planctomycetes bacterium]|nr:hypothetical protein [Planctomycetota bacterium]
MSKLEHLLKDPRSHGAASDPAMVKRISLSALKSWGEEQGQKQVRPRRFPAIRLPWILALAGAMTMLLVLLCRHFPSLPRYDLMLKYGMYDVVDATALGMLQSPLLTSLILAALATGLGFAVSAQARHALRRLF